MKKSVLFTILGAVVAVTALLVPVFAAGTGCCPQSACCNPQQACCK